MNNMQNIREKIEKNRAWKRTFDYFEKTFGEVEIDKIGRYYTIYPKGKTHEYCNLLTTLDMTSLESVINFMHGVCSSGMVKKCFEER